MQSLILYFNIQGISGRAATWTVAPSVGPTASRRTSTPATCPGRIPEGKCLRGSVILSSPPTSSVSPLRWIVGNNVEYQKFYFNNIRSNSHPLSFFAGRGDVSPTTARAMRTASPCSTTFTRTASSTTTCPATTRSPPSANRSSQSITQSSIYQTYHPLRTRIY